jgi:hypothetical protein
MSTEVVLHDQGIHLPRASASKSVFRKYADIVSAGHATGLVRSAESSFGTDHVSAFFDVVERWGVGGVTGAGLAFTGKMMGGLDQGNIPLDATSGLGLGVLGVLGARSKIGSVARAMGGSAMTVFAFRKTEEWLGERKASHHGDSDMGAEDPVIAAAREL